MKKALAVLLAVATLSLTLAAPAMAGSSTDAALALGAFAVFNQFLTGQTIFQRGFAPQPVVVAPPPPVVYAPPPPPPVVYAPPPVVAYPYGYVYAAPRYYYYPRHYGWRHHDD